MRSWFTTIDFDKGLRKWRLLERNRVGDDPADLSPVELHRVGGACASCPDGIGDAWLSALRERWLLMKVLATLDLILLLPRLISEDAAPIQATRTVGVARFASALTGELSSPYLGAAAHIPLIRGAVGPVLAGCVSPAREFRLSPSGMPQNTAQL